ncbi:MAG: hypothetical protein PVH52_01140 [bacterium]|jgi:hypothetical protein
MKGKDDKAGPVKKFSIANRKSKVTADDFASLPDDFSWFAKLERLIPPILKGNDLRELSRRIARARREGRPLILMMGAHVVKCGFGRIISDLIRQDIITGIGVNGAFAIHDVEIAMWGKTSEDVEEGLKQGEFGMAGETSAFFDSASARCLDGCTGLGEALGLELGERGAPNPEMSVLASAASAGIPLTVHVAIGTDIVHQHDGADGRAIGQGSLTDFRRFASLIAGLNGGVVLNIGSAVVLPEVFLKALAIARNRGEDLGEFTTANFDMYSHYRPLANLVKRPRALGGRTFEFLGHHELLLPVFLASVLARLRD